MVLTLLREGLGRILVAADLLTRPKPAQRSPEAQRQADEAARSLSLYQFYACPFCIKTRRALHRLNLTVETRDAQDDPVRRAELQAGGGRIQVPCLRVEEAGEVRWIYESREIIAYLDQHFGAPRPVEA